MKITLRQFTQQPTEYLNKLPITLTRYGKPIAMVTGVQLETQNIIKLKEEKIISENSPRELEFTHKMLTPEKVTKENPYNIHSRYFMGEQIFKCQHGREEHECPICK